MARTKVSLDGRTAYISGAASGIGRALAQILSARGCPLAIVDQDEAGLEHTAQSLPGPVLAHRLDVRDARAQAEFAAEVARWAPTPLGLVGNIAGVTTAQTVAGSVIADDDWVLDINFHGMVHGVRAFLPILLEQDSGVIVNMSSAYGLVGWPQHSAYCASKFAVRGFTDALRQELRDSGVHAVTVVCGGVKSNIARNARYHAEALGPGVTPTQAAEQFEAIARTTPERAAEIILHGVIAGRSRVLVGPDAYLFDAVSRLMPVRYFDFFAGLGRLYSRRG